MADRGTRDPRARYGVEVACPSCAGPVALSSPATMVAVCPYCATTLVVNEEAIRSLGQAALLSEAPSCLAVGWRARCLGREP